MFKGFVCYKRLFRSSKCSWEHSSVDMSSSASRNLVPFYIFTCICSMCKHLFLLKCTLSLNCELISFMLAVWEYWFPNSKYNNYDTNKWSLSQTSRVQACERIGWLNLCYWIMANQIHKMCAFHIHTSNPSVTSTCVNKFRSRHRSISR